ncbi:MAG: hypothetical protein Kow0042_11930 [Calditrichia bacterium]
MNVFFWMVVFQFVLLNSILNKIQEGHGLLITVIGLAAVFSGLGVMWLITAYLPKIVRKIENFKNPPALLQDKQSPEEQRIEEQISPELAAAIALALTNELEDETLSVITLRDIEQDVSPWITASRPTIMRH